MSKVSSSRNIHESIEERTILRSRRRYRCSLGALLFEIRRGIPMLNTLPQFQSLPRRNCGVRVEFFDKYLSAATSNADQHAQAFALVSDRMRHVPGLRRFEPVKLAEERA